MEAEASETRAQPEGGAPDYRSYVGPPEKYDLVSALQFNVLTLLGLRASHYLLDVGCGSLRGGKLFISYLSPGHYYGLEPNQWLIDAGIEHELGRDLVRIKQPCFSNDGDFTLTAFQRSFDFILAQSIFSHAARRQIERCLSQARAALAPTGIFAATFCRGAQDYSGGEWVYPGCVEYTFETMSRLAEQQGLTCTPFDYPHPNGQTWVLFTSPSRRPETPALRAARIQATWSELDKLRAEKENLETNYVKLEAWSRELAAIIAAREREQALVNRWLPLRALRRLRQKLRVGKP